MSNECFSCAWYFGWFFRFLFCIFPPHLNFCFFFLFLFCSIWAICFCKRRRDICDWLPTERVSWTWTGYWMKGLCILKFRLFILLYSLIMLLCHQYTVNRQTLTGFCLCLQGTYSLLKSQPCEQSQAGISSISLGIQCPQRWTAEHGGRTPMSTRVSQWGFSEEAGVE